MSETSLLSKLAGLSGKQWGGLLAVYWLTLATATHLPSDFPGVPGDGWDKLVHFSAFAVLAILVATVWQKSRQLGYGALVVIWILIVVYAALDEWTQTFVGRYCDVFDWLADGVGAASGLAISKYTSWRRSGIGQRP